MLLFVLAFIILIKFSLHWRGVGGEFGVTDIPRLPSFNLNSLGCKRLLCSLASLGFKMKVNGVIRLVIKVSARL